MKKLRRIFFLPDCHHPYVDRKAWRVALKALRAFRPDTLVVLGDFGDFYCTSRHPKNPTRTRDLKVEVDACNLALDELDAACEAVGCDDKRFCLGNHEDNLERYLTAQAPELFSLVSVKDLFLLRGRGYRVTKYKDFDRIGKLVYSHEFGYAGRDAHLRSGADTGANVVLGHSHRAAIAYTSDMLGNHRVAAMAGWLGDPKAAEYMYRSKTKDWSHGFAIGYAEPGGLVHVRPVPIIKYRCVIDGRLIR